MSQVVESLNIIADVDAEAPTTPRLGVTLAANVTFASHQAAIPLVQALSVTNYSPDTTYENLRIELAAEPPVVLPRTWPLSRLRPGDVVAPPNRDVKLDGGFLDKLTERLRTNFTVRLLHGDEVLDEQQHEVIALARNEWGGASTMPELLASFVMPNDSAVAALLSEASDLLRKSGRQHSFEGYQQGTRERPWEMASAIWSAMANRRLVYAEPSASFERGGQKTRDPKMIAEERLATCLDTAVFFASALEQAGLNPIICVVEGHALTGVWLRKASLAELITDDASLVRRYTALRDLIVFETTFICGDPPATFSQALLAGEKHIAEAAEDRFVYALDIKQARGRQIHPLPTLRLESAAEPTRSAAPVTTSIEAPPALPELDSDIADEKPSTPDGRVDYWKRKLLDLTKRNRLLNLKAGKSVIKLVCPDIGAVEDRLADGKTLAIKPIPRLGVDTDLNP